MENAQESGDLGVTGTIGGHFSVMQWLETLRHVDCVFAKFTVKERT